MNITREPILTLAPNEVFVFGSNVAGRHGRGAAATAKKWGARNGKGEGLFGQTYALPTKDERIKTLPLRIIKTHISALLDCAKINPELQFLVTQIGCGLAGYSPDQIAPLFFAFEIPANVSLPKTFFQHQPK